MQIVMVQSADQLEQCLGIRRAVFIEEQNVPESLEIDEMDQLELNKAEHILLLDDDGRSIATARFKRWGEQTAKVQRVAVLRSSRGKGCGAIIMNAVENAARDAGYLYTVLDAQITAEGFYTKLGYQPTSPEHFFDAGIEHIRMYKPLTQACDMPLEVLHGEHE